MEIFANDPLVRIVGVADTSPEAPGLGLAKRLHIRVTRNYRQLLKMGPVDLVIDVSGNPEVGEYLQDIRRMGVSVIGGASAKFMWQLIEARIRATADIEKALNKYQSLYRLYVKETGAAVTEERTRIACEIHDGLAQTLAYLGLQMERLEKLVRIGREEDALLEMGEMREAIQAAYVDAREAIDGLRLAAEHPEQVAARMREYAELGIETFIFSGYPHLEEAYRVAELLFPHLPLDPHPASGTDNVQQVVGEIVANDYLPSRRQEPR